VSMKEFPIEEDITFPSLAYLWNPLDVDLEYHGIESALMGNT
jgi:hypothetical protein